MKKTYGQRAWELNQIIMSMNNEEAYYCGSWLYLWVDECSREECDEYFGTKENYKELEELFIEIYKNYHEDGLYACVENEALAHEWDKKLGLKEIVNYRR